MGGAAPPDGRACRHSLEQKRLRPFLEQLEFGLAIGMPGEIASSWSTGL